MISFYFVFVLYFRQWYTLVVNRGIHLLDLLGQTNMKLKKKLLVLFTSITIIPLAFMTVFCYVQYVRIINKHITTIAENQFENLSMKVRSSYDSIRQTLSFLTFYSTDDNSIISTLRSLKKEEQDISDYDMYLASQNIKTACQSIMYNQKNIQSIYVFTNDRSVFGHTRISTGGISSDYDPVNDSWYQETIALNGEIYISPLDSYPMFGSDTECFFVAHLIRDVDRKFKPLGVIIIAYSPEQFDLSPENALDEMTSISLTNILNQSIIYTNSGEKTLKIVATEQNSTAAPVFRTPFELTMVVDYASLSSEYSHTLYILIIIGVFCVVCVVLLIIRFTHSFINPIEELSSRMLQKQSAHLELPMSSENRKDEIGILYRQYNNMMKEINDSIKTQYQNKLIILDSQMKALEARINSHFLFNTLESINSMAELADQKQISTMSLALGHMFRYAIKTDSELVTLKDELKHVNDYITIQSIRCDEQFKFVQNVPKNLYEEKILKLIFQPIVENSLAYGLEYGNSGNIISLSAEMTQKQLLITVSDNGKGIPEERLIVIKKHLQEEASFTELGHRKRESIGLKNIQSRIELYYGKGYGLSIESVEGKGTKIEVLVPVFPDSQEVTEHV